MILGERHAHRGVLMRVWAWVWTWVDVRGQQRCVDTVAAVGGAGIGKGVLGTGVGMGALGRGVAERVQGMALRRYATVVGFAVGKHRNTEPRVAGQWVASRAGPPVLQVSK